METVKVDFLQRAHNLLLLVKAGRNRIAIRIEALPLGLQLAFVIVDAESTHILSQRGKAGISGHDGLVIREVTDLEEHIPALPPVKALAGPSDVG